MAEKYEQIPDFRKYYPLHDDESCAVPDRESVIDRYVAKELSAEERDAFDEHAFHCNACFEELRQREELAEVLAERLVLEQQRSIVAVSLLTAVLRHRYFRRAAVFAAPLILIVVAIFGIKNYQQAREQQRALFAANATESPTLERLLDQYQRAGSIEVVSPPIGASVENEIVFAWQGGAGGKLAIKILNNREEEVQNFAPVENRFVFRKVKQALSPGLYYWKLEDENDLIYVGKFFVGKPE